MHAQIQASRPIIFVCHSLGGLVCEDVSSCLCISTYRSFLRLSTIQTLVLSGNRSEPHLSSIWSSTRDIVFLGTPHHGSGLANWTTTMGRVVGYLKQVNDKILKVFKSDSEVLARIQDSFHNLIKIRNESRAADTLPPVNITCFFEEVPFPEIGMVRSREIPLPFNAEDYFANT